MHSMDAALVDRRRIALITPKIIEGKIMTRPAVQCPLMIAGPGSGREGACFLFLCKLENCGMRLRRPRRLPLRSFLPPAA